MKNNINLSKICPENCRVIWTTSESNGYPRNERQAIVDFENEAQLSDFLKKHPDFNAVFLTLKPGWSHYYVCGEPIGNHIDNTIDIPELFTWVDKSDHWFVNTMTETADEFPEDAELARELISAFENLKDDEILVYSFTEYSIPIVTKRYTMCANNEWQDSVLYKIGAMCDY